MEGFMEDVTKIRKRGCSPSSSTSSIIQNYKFKRAILAGKRGGVLGSSTPVPAWRMVGSRSPSVVLHAGVVSPKYPLSLSNRLSGQPPVSARKLAATLWELNEVPVAAVGREGMRDKRVGRKEKVKRCVNPHLSDPSHSPVSERMERSRSCSHQRRETSSLCRRVKMDTFDLVSSASFMEIETRSQCHTPSGSKIHIRTHLKDVSNALTTSKELLKIITRMLGNEYQPSISMSLISALHAELERARLQINQLIQEESSDHKEINLLVKHFAQEKAALKNKELSIAGELEVERKLRTRFESLNKKLGKELAENQMKLLSLKQKNGVESGLDLVYRRDGDLAFCQSESMQSDKGETEDSNDDGENSVESDLNSLEFNMDDPNKLKGRKSLVTQVARRSASLLRSKSGVIEWGNSSNYKVEKQVHRKSCGDEKRGYRLEKGKQDYKLPSSRLGLEKELASLSSQLGQPWLSRNPSGTMVRLEDDRVEGLNVRKSRR